MSKILKLQAMPDAALTAHAPDISTWSFFNCS
jgi:hypothetical protein